MTFPRWLKEKKDLTMDEFYDLSDSEQAELEDEFRQIQNK